ncbi:deleted in malignant brain tumors 1 protein-like [Branchiostoma floridae]|uniref:Deleted in malignant brain tumors 1 protein-like n=1 Tax=Branchiostoma floridae TaxID=7739 RepID=A0A9J7KTX9_BRAFL|nr:deleted in malignant brain tumors 1 protein-like [Branchiostoma floridae]
MDQVACTGTESRLTDCPHNGWGYHDCAIGEDAGVSCYDLWPRCDFQHGAARCGFTQDTTDDTNWVWGSQHTPTSNTGPPHDNTFRNSTGKYMYVEASGGAPGDTARLISAPLNTENNICLNFNYHMYGTQVGTLNVYVKQRGSSSLGEVIFSRSDFQGDQWKFSELALPKREGFAQIVFETVRGSGAYGDIAIDDVGIITDACVRLTGGNTSAEGRVEVLHYGEWGTVCNDRWGDEDAQVVCRQLGYRYARPVSSQRSFGRGGGHIWMDQVACTGNESRLADCPHNGWGDHDCAHDEDASVSCYDFTGCDEYRASGRTASGVYTMFFYPDRIGTYCDMDTAGGGWTVIQRRQDGSVPFNRTWEEYKLGFGDKKGEFWLGNEVIHLLTNFKNHQLRIDMEDWGGNKRFALYSTFRVSGEADGYRLHISGYSGTAGDSMTGSHSLNGRRFSTVDRDNDAWSSHCSRTRGQAGWWFNSCTHSVLNGRYLGNCVSPCSAWQGVVWNHWKGEGYSLKSVSMKIRPIVFETVRGSGAYGDIAIDDVGILTDACVRLTGGNNTAEGRVEVLHYGEWGTICNDRWGDEDAQVVCRQLGYRYARPVSSQRSFGRGGGHIWMDQVACIGNESRLADCPHNGWGDHDCAHDEDASVSCYDFTGCEEYRASGRTASGVYTMFFYPDRIGTYCDMDTAGGGWTVIQRRQDGSVPFNRNWEEYKLGFGDKKGEFWLGNENIHLLTNFKNHELRIDMEDWQGNKRFALYSTFRVSGEADGYRLHISGYSGNAGDSMAGALSNNGQRFSTVDRDNDAYTSGHCSQRWGQGGWWFAACSYSYLNGRYLGNCGNSCTSWQGVVWYHWRGAGYSLTSVSMKIRP